MAVNWLEIAKKMAEDARAQLALNRQRLQEILAERARQQSAQGPQPEAASVRPNIKDFLLGPGPRFEMTLPKRGRWKMRPPIDLD